MNPLPRPSLPRTLALLLLLLLFLLPLLPLLLAACSGDDAPSPNPDPGAPSAQAGASDTETDPAPAGTAPALSRPAGAVILPVRFENDPTLEALIDPDALDLPGRFFFIPRDDREPILTLGLVQSAARVTYAVTASNEILSFDLLRLNPEIDPEEFFLAFAETIADTPDYRGLDTIGVPRGVGDRARHFAFTLDGDDGDAIVLLRGDILAFVTYRRPPNLRQPLDIAVLSRALDEVLQAALP